MRAMASKDSLLGTLARWLGLTVVLGSGVGALISAHRGVTLEEFAVAAAISMLYSAMIGLPAMLVFPRLRPRIYGKPELTQWLTYLGVLLAITAVGTLVAGLVLVTLGVVPLDELWS